MKFHFFQWTLCLSLLTQFSCEKEKTVKTKVLPALELINQRDLSSEEEGDGLPSQSLEETVPSSDEEVVDEIEQ